MNNDQLPQPVQGAAQDAPQAAQQTALQQESEQPSIQSEQPIIGTAASSAATASDLAVPIAEDVDLIEKEWVTRAKNIVAQTRSNPNEQSKELGKVKATYIKSRYGKDMKVGE